MAAFDKPPADLLHQKHLALSDAAPERPNPRPRRPGNAMMAALLLASLPLERPLPEGPRVTCEGCQATVSAADPAGSYVCPCCGHAVYVDPDPPPA